MKILSLPKIWKISLALTIFIILIGGISIWVLIYKVIKAKIPCTPSYLTPCQTALDCFFQIRKCEAGRGIICLPQCKYEGYSFSCLRGKCIWSKKGKDQFEKDLIPL